jgi:hypothetical protein
MSDAEIRAVARRAIVKHPRYIVLRKIQLALTCFLMVATAGFSVMAKLEVGVALALGGLVGTAFILTWNTVWTNTALYRITREEMQAD